MSTVPPGLADPRRTALQIALLCVALAAPSAVAFAFDARTLHGVSVWSKPLKFQLSFALHWLTVAWLLQHLDRAAHASRPLRAWLGVGGAASVVEVLYITLQAARGRASHFNFSTPLETTLYYALMGGAALVMMAATIAVGVFIWRRPAGGLRGPAWLGAVLGLTVGSLATLLATAPLAAGWVDGPGPWVGGVRSDVRGLPLTGWSTTGGDLRVPHFVATHLLQALAIAGWLQATCSRSRQRGWVWAALALGLLALAATFAQAVAGVPLVRA